MIQPPILLEACVESVAASVAAEAAGADRLELCTALELGGLSPGLGLVRSVRAQVQIPIHVLLRPRAGDFVYDSEELGVVLEEIQALQDSGVEGIVVGALDTTGLPPVDWLRACKAIAGPMNLTFHRAFDQVADQEQALDHLIQAGVDRVLTSGGAASADLGKNQLKTLMTQAAGRIKIMPGGKVDALNAPDIIATTRATELHFSAVKLTTTQWPWLQAGARLGLQTKEGDTRMFIPDPEKVAALRSLWPRW